MMSLKLAVQVHLAQHANLIQKAACALMDLQDTVLALHNWS